MSNAPKIAVIFLASGHSTRFSGNKLTTAFAGRMLVDVIFDHLPAERFRQIVVVTRYAPVAASAAERRFAVAENFDETGDIAHTIRLGMQALLPQIDGVMFSVCDQPLLTSQSIGALCDEFMAHPDSICALGYHNKRGNPVIFPRALFDALATLPSGKPGGHVIEAHLELLRIVEAAHRRELVDVDSRADLQIALDENE